MQETVDSLKELMTLDELCKRLGMSVRNVRFYTTRGLVPPPIRRGRSGYYTADHVARLELVLELQAHGFTLAAIEKYVGRIPEDASASTISLHRTLLAPWMAEHPETLGMAELTERCGRKLTSSDIETLAELGILTPAERGKYDVAIGHLEAGLKLISIGYPKAAATAASKIFSHHADAIAEAITQIFRDEVWPAYRASGASDAELAEAIEVLKPLSIATLVSAFEHAMNAQKRETIQRRAR
ncbi:DNA-binding transcriptional MerR regulator [Nocardioides daedukensis]|uniref:DNA-binding transcriptional MerR regulator n=1 Tax=Nocardioides daedukensis TaxID=634462 RepID=A0A7Y9UVY6_9ACTN|nr:MerR family transcriptional regulator [Nocardioides daedukensis]NYG59640.1 DNA-binding transcriptional MerR regulator [Nocardioides daedukensis]